MSKSAQSSKKSKESSAASVIKIPKKLAKMRQNPQDDWKIGDIKQVATALGMEFDTPKRGSHCTVFSEYLKGPLTIPARKPIKAIYIKQFVKKCEAHISELEKQNEND